MNLKLGNKFSRRAAAIITGLCLGLPGHAVAGNGVQLSVIDTGNSAGNLESMVVDGGSWTTWRKLVMTAILVRHPQGDLLLDTGYGSKLDAHFDGNPWFEKLLLKYENVNPVVDQLAAVGMEPSQISMIIPTHMHWDHVDAIEDFPGVPVLVPEGAVESAREGERSAFISEQFDDPAIHWQALRFDGGPVHGFDRSHDLFADGSVLLVPLDSHTAHDVGVFVRIDSGQQFFFIGDISWTLRGVAENRARPWLTTQLFPVDRDPEALASVLGHIHRLSRENPQLVIVPAHDEILAASMPQFPSFTQ